MASPTRRFQLSTSLLLVAALGLCAAPMLIAAAASAPSPPPVRPCQLCMSFVMVPPKPDTVGIRWTSFGPDEAREEFATLLDSIYDEAVDDGLVAAPLAVKFINGKNITTPTNVTICGTFASVSDAATSQPLFHSSLNFALGFADCGYYPGYQFRFSSSAGSCMKVLTTKSCPRPFPKCGCNIKQGITSLKVSPELTVAAGRTSKTSLYCFNIEAISPEDRVPSSCLDNTLSKVEFFADDSNYFIRKSVTGFRVTPAGGSSSWLKPVWGALGEKAVRATPLNWSMASARGGEVCMEVVKGIPLQDICMDGTCVVSLFNDNRKCCPIYTSGLPAGASAASAAASLLARLP